MTELTDELVNESLYALFQDGATLTQLLHAVRGLTDCVHRDPAVHSNSNAERLLTDVHQSLTAAIEASVKLDEHFAASDQ